MENTETELVLLLEDIYGSAYWALEAGATEESLYARIEEALECHEETLRERREGVPPCRKVKVETGTAIVRRVGQKPLGGL